MKPVDEFIELYNVVLSNNRLNENISVEHLMEMSKLTARETGLPVDIWVDEGKTFTKAGHGKRIKFQGDKSNSNSNNWIPLTVSKNPIIPIKNVKHNLSNQELNQIITFVVNNFDILNKLGEPNFGITDFVNNMKKL